MQAVNMRSDDVVFDFEDRLLRLVRRVALAPQSPTVEVSLVGVARLRKVGPSELTIRVNTRGSLVTLRQERAEPFSMLCRRLKQSRALTETRE
jgi:hypothetical protein